MHVHQWQILSGRLHHLQQIDFILLRGIGSTCQNSVGGTQLLGIVEANAQSVHVADFEIANFRIRGSRRGSADAKPTSRRATRTI